MLAAIALHGASLDTKPDIARTSIAGPRDGFAQRLYRRIMLRTWKYLYFGNVRVMNRVPVQPGTLYLSTHRNGGIDGAIAHCAAGGAPVPVAASQITRSLWGRWTGCIEVVRATDRVRHGHAATARDPLADALSRLAAGESLLWFPEGTSDGGPQLLPIKRGAARLLAVAVGQGVAVRVVVMGLHYQAMDALQSDVEVEVSEPLELQPSALATIAVDMRTGQIQQRIETALRASSIEYPDIETQLAIETLTARLELPIIQTRRALLRLTLPKLNEWSRRARVAARIPPALAWPWLLPWISAAIVWLPTLAIVYAITRRADRNNKAFIRSLLAMPLIAINLALSSWIVALSGVHWPLAVLLVALSLPLGLLVHRQLRRAQSRIPALRRLHDDIVSHGLKNA